MSYTINVERRVKQPGVYQYFYLDQNLGHTDIFLSDVQEKACSMGPIDNRLKTTHQWDMLDSESKGTGFVHSFKLFLSKAGNKSIPVSMSLGLLFPSYQFGVQEA